MGVASLCAARLDQASSLGARGDGMCVSITMVGGFLVVLLMSGSGCPAVYSQCSQGL